MKKLHLDLDALDVESFHTVSGDALRGTVHGHAPSYWPEPCAPTDRVTDCNDPSCAASCAGNTCESACACDPGTGGCTSVTCVPRQCMGS